jgi:hydrogenase expression/formation protein HypE
MDDRRDFTPQCPLPLTDYPQVLMAHGGGGKLMHQLIEKMIVPAFGNPALDTRHDSAILTLGDRKIAFTTDSFVVRPMFFPGGDIGSLAINGTVNDLAMSGARPLYLSAAFIIEEGLPMDTLWRIVQSMQQAARAVGVDLVTGDTKVVDKGKGDGLYINTAGIGVIEHRLSITPGNVQPGDAIIVSGDIGRHGMAIMAVREGLAFESEIESDCAPLWAPVRALLDNDIPVHCLRDLTRGGLSSALIEIAEAGKVGVNLDETTIPVRDDVRGACEILGLDPMYVANEGRFIAFVPFEAADRACAVLRQHDVSANPSVIGRVVATDPGLVTMKSQIGATRIIDMLSGEQLPRIC